MSRGLSPGHGRFGQVSADAGLAELDAEVDLAARGRLGELELDAARRALAVLLEDVPPAGGEDDVVEAQVARRVAAHEDAASAGGLVGEDGRAVLQRVDPAVGVGRAVRRADGRRGRSAATAAATTAAAGEAGRGCERGG